MDSEVFQNVIRDPNPDKVPGVMSDIAPEIVQDIIPSLFSEVQNGKDSEKIAEQTLDQIFNVVEEDVLGDGVNFIIEKFGDRIIDMVTGNMFSIFERVTMMIVGN